jgi:hypothetical protein
MSWSHDAGRFLVSEQLSEAVYRQRPAAAMQHEGVMTVPFFGKGDWDLAMSFDRNLLGAHHVNPSMPVISGNLYQLL